MIGKSYKSMTPYYDNVTKQRKFKSRPCLVIDEADNGDYVALPISTTPDNSKIDAYYDIPLDKTKYTFLNKNSD